MAVVAVESLEVLREGLADGVSASRPAGIEVRQDLVPAGSLPVQPPSYNGKLEIHERHLDDGQGGLEQRKVIELDSVGSAANRIEEVLLDLHRAGEYPLPVSSATVRPSVGEPITITTLEAPHRIYDAWIREAEAPDGKTSFEKSEHGRELSYAHVGALDPILETSAHDLLFGIWDSHNKGPHGQVRLARSLATTVIGLDPIPQARFAARRDPLNLGEGAEKAKKGERLSDRGLSSIPPTVIGGDHAEGGNGGVSITEARHLGFLSFASLRRLGFAGYDATDARVLLAALGLYGLALRATTGWTLRSGCSLVPKGEPRYVVVSATGERQDLELTPDTARELFEAAVAAVPLEDRSVQLEAGKNLNDIVDKAVASKSDES